MTGTPQVIWCPARDKVFVQGNLWSTDFPGSDLARWLAFYRRLRDRREGRYAKHYFPIIEALEEVQCERRAAL